MIVVPVWIQYIFVYSPMIPYDTAAFAVILVFTRVDHAQGIVKIAHSVLTELVTITSVSEYLAIYAA